MITQRLLCGSWHSPLGNLAMVIVGRVVESLVVAYRGQLITTPRDKKNGIIYTAPIVWVIKTKGK